MVSLIEYLSCPASNRSAADPPNTSPRWTIATEALSVVGMLYNWSSVWRSWHEDVIKWKRFPRYKPFVRGSHRWIPHKKARTLSFDVFFDLRLNKRLSKQPIHHRAHFGVSVMDISAQNQLLKVLSRGRGTLTSDVYMYWWQVSSDIGFNTTQGLNFGHIASNTDIVFQLTKCQTHNWILRKIIIIGIRRNWHNKTNKINGSKTIFHNIET